MAANVIRSGLCLVLLAGAAALGAAACGGAEPDDFNEEESSLDPEAESVGETVDELNSCNPCYVRCTNAAPASCHWTGVHNIGKEKNCTSAGKAWCANHGYAHTWAGCSASLHYPNCP